MDGNRGKKHEPEDVREAARLLSEAGLSSTDIASRLLAKGLLRPTGSNTVKKSMQSASRKIRKWLGQAKISGSSLSKRQRKAAKTVLIRKAVRVTHALPPSVH